MPRFLPGLMFVVCSLSGSLAAAAVSQAISLPDAAGQEQVLGACTRCHGVDVIVAQPRSPDQWAEVVSVMVGHGAALTDDEYDKIVTYLSTNLAPRDPAD
jgi:mono/diheme cytochrome c family protein